MYHAAEPGKRRAAGGLLLSMALTSFLTGVTEPIEFTFMFLAPLLYGVHAVLTGLAMVLMDQLGVRLGFSFSAGLFDYVINFGQATRPWLLLPVGAVYALVYYATFRFVIVRFALRTPGREEEAVSGAEPALESSGQAAAMIAALGGAGNLTAIDACTTRLRLNVVDQAKVDEAALRRLGARGFVRPSKNTLQVVVGPIADQLAGELRTASRLQAPATPLTVQPATTTGATSIDVEPELVDGMLHAFGGRKNVADVAAASTRLLVTVRDGAAVDENALRALKLRGVARPTLERVHLLLGATADAYRVALQQAVRG